MSRDFRPRPGNRAVGVWPLGQPPPAGWARSGISPTLVARVLDGMPADQAVEAIGYTDSADCGLSNATRARALTGGPR